MVEINKYSRNWIDFSQFWKICYQIEYSTCITACFHTLKQKYIYRKYPRKKKEKYIKTWQCIILGFCFHFLALGQIKVRRALWFLQYYPYGWHYQGTARIHSSMLSTAAKQLKRDFWEIYNKRCEPIIPSEQYKQDQELNHV